MRDGRAGDERECAGEWLRGGRSHLRRWWLPLLLVPGLLLPAARASAQNAGAAGRLMADSRVKAALDHARTTETQTINEQIRFCEVPAPPFQESARGEVLRKAFVDAGLKNVRVDRAGNVLGERPGTAAGSAPRLVIASHLDTVFPEGTVVRISRDANGTLHGPGIGDNCRGLAVLAAVIRALNAGSVETPGTITFVANVGEEGLGDLRGMKALFNDTLKGRVDRLVSIDGGGLFVTNVGVGSHRYRVTFTGPGGHSFGAFGLPNPANALGRAVARIADIQVPASPRTTFNVGRIGGGTSVNAIPAEAWMEIDVRSSDPAQLSSVDARIQAAIDAAVADENRRWRSSARVAVRKELVGDRPAGSLPATAPIVQAVQAAGQALLGLSIPLSEGSTDANLPLSLGIPAVAIGGGGDGNDAHATTESWASSESWKGTLNAVLVTVLLAQP